MAKYNSEKVTRASLLDSNEFAHIKEALTLGAEANTRLGRPMDIMRPIRETPLSAFFDKSEHSMMGMRANPNLPEIWHRTYGIRVGEMAKTNPYVGGMPLRETIAIPNTLSILKIADEIIEGAEPWSDWKQYDRLIDMDTPKVNVPRTKYTDTVGGADADNINIFAESGGKPPVIGK